MNCEAIAEYRKMVDAATDYVLMAFGRHMRERDIGRGYPGRSAGFACGGLSSFEDLEDRSEAIVGSGAATIIYSDMMAAHRLSLTAVYVGGPTLPPDLNFLEAVTSFERRAKARGIL